MRGERIGTSALSRSDTYVIRNTESVLRRKKFNLRLIKKTYFGLKEAAKSARSKTDLDAIQDITNGLAIRLQNTTYREPSEQMYFGVIDAIKKRDEELRTTLDSKGGHASIRVPGVGGGAGLTKTKSKIPPADYSTEEML
jgi:hypothetical protein